MPRDEAAFFGRVTAESARELENLFAAIRQTATSASGGALQVSRDVSGLSGMHDHRLSDLSDQCDRGEQLARALKEFAQVAEHRRERYHLGEITEHVVRLCTPLAQRSGVRLKHYGCSSMPVTEYDPLLVQMGVFAVIDIFLAVAPLVKEIRLRCGQYDVGIWMDFEWITDDFKEEADAVEVEAGAKWERLHERVADLGALMELHATEKRLRIVLPSCKPDIGPE